MKIKFFSKIEMTLLVVVIIFAATFTNAYALNPVTPTNIRPADGETITTLTPTFEWSEFEDGDRDTQRGYHLRVRCDACDPNGKDTTAYDTGFIADTSANSHTYSVGAYSGVDPVTLHPLKSDPLEPNKQYHWHVRYLDSAGEWSDYSAEFPPYHYFYVAGFAPFPDDTVSLWHLDEIAGPDYVDAFDGNDGTGNTAPTSEAYGRVNWAQRFDGANTGIDVPEGWSFNWYDDSSFSIEFWVKTDGAVAPITNQVVIGRDDAATNLHWWVGLNKTDGLASFVLRDSGGNGPGSLLGVGTISLADGNWHHVVAVRDLGTGDNILYVDGNVQGRTNYDYPYTAWFGSNDAALNIGWLNLSHGYHFKGLIDEVAIYDRALTPTEIEDHYIAGVAGESIESLRPRPDAHAGADQPNVKETTVVSLNGTASSAGYAGSQIASYSWEQTAGTAVSLSGATTAMANFIAPDVVAAGETLTFLLTVTADDFQSNSDTVDIAIIDRVSPVANAGADQNAKEKTVVTLDGSNSSDADGTIVSFAWAQTTGSSVTLTNDNTAAATFTAPDVGPAGETLEFELTVTDDDGLASTDKVTVNITDIPVCNLPATPSSIIYPPGSNDGSFIVSWSSVSAAGSYTLQRATDASFSAATTVYSGSSTFHSVTGLDAGTYYFRVRATNSCGSSDWKAGGNGIGVGSDSAEIEAFVTRFYELCLGRLPDSAGLNGWVNALLNRTKTGADVARGFILSPEFIKQNIANEDYLQVLYKAFFNRDPDKWGYDIWLAELNGGKSREDVLNGFIYAQEFKNLCDDYGIIAVKVPGNDDVAAFVTRFYQLCLGRNPDPAGLEGWVNALLDQSKAGADVAEGFIYSPEFIAKNTTHSEYLLILYKAFFNRAADPAGWDTWLVELNSGRDRGQVLDGFIYSQEFAALCKVYGIIPITGPVVPEPGSLQVTLKPQLAVNAGAGWKVDGGGWDWQESGATISPLSVGDHMVKFKPISGWDAPASKKVTITSNTIAQLAGEYKKQTTGGGDK